MNSGSTFHGALARAVLLSCLAGFTGRLAGATNEAFNFSRQIEPLLQEHCFDCHGDGMEKGGLALDRYKTEPAFLHDTTTWLAVWRKLDADLMPPPRKSRLLEEDRRRLQQWIVQDLFSLDLHQPDPGKATVRRLNRTEYQNTIQDWLGIHYPTVEHFPPDDTGYGFDNIGDVLSLSPLLMEKYLDAAQLITREFLQKARIAGPQDGSKSFHSPEYHRLLPDGPPPTDPGLRKAYATRILRSFAERAFRSPVDEATLQRLVKLAMQADGQPGATFEQALGQALTAMLASPRFLFHAEQLPGKPVRGEQAWIDEFALASRLSYLLWSSLPDDELFALARTNGLRARLNAQVERMLADRRSDRFVENFVGQWLQLRDVDTAAPDPVHMPGLGNGSKRVPLTPALRQAMKRETELFFADLLRNDGTLTDLLTARESFLNEPLAAFYGVPGVGGDRMRKVRFPDHLPRAGLLTHASVLLVTSNPTRTSPVKRGLFILDNLLGTPPPPPPPNVPELEEAKKALGRTATMRELMVAHREKPMCASCHERMDPLGLAFEHYNAMGGFREAENGRPIDTSGALITGEEFTDAAGLTKILTTSRRHDLYRCVTEKFLTYALGRGTEYYDLPTITEITAQLERDNGRLKTLLFAVVNSAPFQMHRREPVGRAPADGLNPAK